MATDLLTVGVIGTGHLGSLHAKMLSTAEHATLVGVYDANADAAAKTAAEYKTTAFQSLPELLSRVSAVSIAATTTAHYQLALTCLNAGKHIFIEKPITATIPEGEEIVRLAEQRNLIIQVGHIERFNPALLAIDKYITAPLFMQTDRLAQFNPRGTDVAVVMDLMIHDIDIILSLVKSEVTRVDANGVAVVSGNIDIANARIEFANGAVANVTASRISQKKMRKMRVFQRDAYVAMDFITGTAEVYRLIPAAETPQGMHIAFGEIGTGEKKKKIIYEHPEHLEINALQHELQLFVNAVRGGTLPVVSGADGLRALRVADTIITKIAESQEKIGGIE